MFDFFLSKFDNARKLIEEFVNTYSQFTTKARNRLKKMFSK